MTFLEFFTPYIIVGTLCAVCGWAVARSKSREPYALEFLELNGYSLQCLHGQFGEDHLFAVTDGSSKVIGKAAYTPREAIDSAIGHVAFEHTGDEA